MTKEYKNWLFVEVPEDAAEYLLRATEHCDKGSISFTNKWTGKETTTLIPPGSWLIVGMSGQLGEEEAKGIVDKVDGWSSDLYYSYTAPARDYRDIVEAAFTTATESLASLIESMGMKNDCTLILKKK